MANKLVLRSDGIREMLKSQEILDVCVQYANQMGANLGEGYEVSEYTGANRVNASVSAVSDAAKRDTLENNSLLKAGGNND